MTDIATLWDSSVGYGDWVISVGTSNVIVSETGDSIRDASARPYLGASTAFTGTTGLRADQDLQTAVLISLFTDAQADADDVIPDGTSDPRGWWAGSIGSKLWLRARSKATEDLPALIQNDIQTALQWLIEDDVAASVDVLAEYRDAKTIAAQVTVNRRDGTRIAVGFSRVWEKI